MRVVTGGSSEPLGLAEGGHHTALGGADGIHPGEQREQSGTSNAKQDADNNGDHRTWGRGFCFSRHTPARDRAAEATSGSAI